MTFVTKEDLDEFESRMNAWFHGIDRTLEEIVLMQQAHGTMLGELVMLMSKLTGGRRPSTGPATPTPEQAVTRAR